MASVIPENAARFTREELLGATRGECTLFSGHVSGVWTDSRARLEGGVFVALKGERFDGHRFVEQAVQRGARVVVVEEPLADAAGAAILRVPSTLEALGQLAAFHRRRWHGRIVTVAGSVGKTTTRSAVAAVLGAAVRGVFHPRGNLNNLVGVPMVLLALTEHHDIGVVELGTSFRGEIERLARMADPDVSVLTRIALEHCAGLGDLDAIEREEGDALARLRADAVAVANRDDARCSARLEASSAMRRVGYGLAQGDSSAPSGSAAEADYRIVSCRAVSASRTRVSIRRPTGPLLDAESPLLGLPGAYALAAAVAASEAALDRPLEPDELALALRSPELGEPGRLTPIAAADGALVLDDTYNSSPASVLSSVKVARELADQRGARLLLVLGEMRELGELSRSAHREVGEGLVAAAPALVVAFGGDARGFLEAPRRAGHAVRFASDAVEALDLVAADRRAGDVILVKASRSLRAERIVQGLVSAAAKGGPA